MRQLALFFLFSSLFGNPSHPHALTGDATFNAPIAGSLQVTAADKAIIDWSSFSIDAGETTQFIQPSANATVLNRVIGNTYTSIAGALTANGKVFLLNPNGILVTPTGTINVAGFIGTTLPLNHHEFFEGGDLSFTGISPKWIVNKGMIVATTSDALLIGSKVVNSGTVMAPMGLVALVEGQAVVLKPSGMDRILIKPSFRFQDETSPLVSNTGTLSGKEVALIAASSPFELAINVGGEIEATGLEMRDGKIILYAEKGEIDINGSLRADRGNIECHSPKITLQDEAFLDVSGEGGGGNILLADADTVFLSPKATLTASAHREGNGGKVILRSLQGTFAKGSIEAKGGSKQGDGGFVEISSFGHLSFPGKISTTAPHGKNGTLFIDPSDIIINAGPTNPGPFTPTYDPVVAGTAIVASADIVAALTGGNDVTISTFNGTGGSGNITLSPGFPINWGTNNSLTLIAAESGTITLLDNVQCGGTGTISLQAGGDIQIGMLTPTNDSNISTQGILLANAGGSISIFGDAAFNGSLAAFDRFEVVAEDSILFDGRNGGSAQIFAFGGTSSISTLTARTGDINVLGNQGAAAIQTITSSLDLNVGRNMVVESIGTGFGFVSIDHDLNARIGNNLTIHSDGINLTAIVANRTSNVVVGNDVFITNTGTSQSLLVAFAPGSSLTATIGGNLIEYNTLPLGPMVASGIAGFEFLNVHVGGSILLNLHSVFAAGQGPLLGVAGKDFYIGPGSAVDTFAPSVSDRTFTLVVDNDFPSAPFIGPGSFLIDPSALGVLTFNFTSPTPVTIQVFTARRSQNQIPASIPLAGQTYIPGPLNVDTETERWSTYYPNGFVGPIYTLFYKEPQVNAAEFNEIAQIYGNAFDILNQINETLMPWNLEFCITNQVKTCYPIRIENYRRRIHTEAGYRK
jgi:filamentous hemagglutinin family protein